MGGLIINPFVYGGSVDPYFSSTVLLLGFEGSDGDTGAPGMTDESPSAHGTASSGSTHAKISTAQAKFGGSSLRTDGSGVIGFADHADWDFGNSPFTIELFMRPIDTGVTQFLVGPWAVGGTKAWVLYFNLLNKISFNLTTDGSTAVEKVRGATSLSADTWYHVAFDFDGTKYRVYVDGAFDNDGVTGSPTTVVTIANVTDALAIGHESNISADVSYNGYIDELRITKGVARYASDSGFTVPASAYPRS